MKEQGIREAKDDCGLWPAWAMDTGAATRPLDTELFLSKGNVGGRVYTSEGHEVYRKGCPLPLSLIC